MFNFVDEGKRELYTFEEKHPKIFSCGDSKFEGSDF